MLTLDELLRQHEDCELEVKAAQGRDWRGEVPRSVWESYSAMANTTGGLILLGVEEDKAGDLHVLGLKDIARVRKSFWDGVNNPQIVNINLLRDQDVQEVELDVGEVEPDWLRILAVRVPRASRTQRPVYTGPNPLTGTYRRNYEGDYKCDPETVRRILAEAVEEVRDARILPGYGLGDLDAESLAAYRNEMKSELPNHPFLAGDDLKFLADLGGWGRDRQTGEEGLTIAGLLMFGRLPSILDALPNYVVDYQEHPLPPSRQRWLDRVTTDGTWSGNLYEFYKRIYKRLTADLKVPFQLQANGRRVDETPVHEALREALVNTLIHADYTDRISVLIVKRDDYFGFRNPGVLRLPVDIVLRGGQSDCRNRRLQKMFQLIGAAEQAGSGYPKILRAWHEQHWRYPLLDEKYEPDQTLLRLPTTSLLPPEAMTALDQRFGARFRKLDEIERLAVVIAYLEEKVTNRRLRMVTDTHASDLTTLLKSLVSEGFLLPDGVGRGTSYRLPGTHHQLILSDSLFSATTPADGGKANANQSSPHLVPESEQSSPHLGSNSPHLVPESEQSSPHLGSNSPHLVPESEQSSPHLGSNSPHLVPESEQDERLLRIAAPVKITRSAPAKLVRQTILELCRFDYLPLKVLASLLGRKPGNLRDRYLSILISEGLLEYQYPDRVNHPTQGYRTKATKIENGTDTR